MDDYFLQRLPRRRYFSRATRGVVVSLILLLTACYELSSVDQMTLLSDPPGRSDNASSVESSDTESMTELTEPVSTSKIPEEVIAKTRDYLHVIILGDSIMFHSAGGPHSTAAHLIARDDNLYVTNLSQSGQTMGSAVEHQLWGMIEFLVRRKQPEKKKTSALVIQLGHNDFFQYGSELLKENYTIMLEKVSELHVDTFCVVPVRARWDSEQHTNQYGAEYEEARNVVREIALSGLCELIETEDWFTDTDVFDGYTMPDGLHFGERGHLVFKNRLMEFLR